jgi:hypothetical protein
MFGMISDILAIDGFRRTPYIIIAACVGAISQFFLSGVIPFSLVVVCLFMVGVNFSIACPDVMVDASIAVKVQQNKEFSSDLQSLCWGSYAFCSIFGYTSAGVFIYYLGAPTTVGLMVIISCIVFTTASLGFLGEERLQNSNPSSSPLKTRSFFTIDLSVYRANQRLFLLALCVSMIAVILTIVTIATDDFIVQVLVVISCATAVACLCYFVNIKRLPEIAKFSVFIFLIESLTPNLETAMFYWWVWWWTETHLKSRLTLSCALLCSPCCPPVGTQMLKMVPTSPLSSWLSSAHSDTCSCSVGWGSSTNTCATIPTASPSCALRSPLHSSSSFIPILLRGCWLLQVFWMS